MAHDHNFWHLFYVQSSQILSRSMPMINIFFFRHWNQAFRRVYSQTRKIVRRWARVQQWINDNKLYFNRSEVHVENCVMIFKWKIIIGCKLVQHGEFLLFAKNKNKNETINYDKWWMTICYFNLGWIHCKNFTFYSI